MSNQAIYEYLVAIFCRYQEGNKAEKSKMLSEAQLVCGLSRKHLIRQLNGDIRSFSRLKASGRPKTYPTEELLPHIRRIWIDMERVTARRLKAGMDEDWLDYYLCEPHIKIWLRKMSVSSMARALKKIRGTLEANKGLSGTSPARFMKNKIPINTFTKSVDRPGYTQSDTVAHCGTSLLGGFANTLTLTDLDTTWTETRASYGKKAVEIRKNFNDIEMSLPFKLLAVNTDSGSEFLNNEILEFTNFGKRIHFTRSRPYQKNDNCYVEQKNFTHVRQIFGYDRIDNPELIDLMNEIYKEYWNPLQNFFIPNFKLIEKFRLGSKIKKKYDKPKTPYRRIIESPHVSEEQKKTITEKKLKLNPFTLKKGLEEKLSLFYKKLRQSKVREISA